MVKQKGHEPIPILDHIEEKISKPVDGSTWQEQFEYETEKHSLAEKSIRLRDFEWRLEKRNWMKWFLFWLLIVQNVVVLAITVYAIVTGQAKETEDLLSVLVGATLLETTSMVFIMVKWLFSEIPYNKK